MTAVVERAVRLAYLLSMFESKQRISVAEIAEKFEVSERTIRRDLLTLQGEPFYLPLEQERVYRRQELVYRRQDVK
jgi:predicted DNA-binding transcriptional regulator YafY